MKPPSQNEVQGPPRSSAYLLSEVGGLPEAERLRRQARALLGRELPLVLKNAAPGGVLVDLGCGSGLLADAIAAARPDLRVWGVDADALAVASAQRLFGGRENLSFLQRSLEEGPGGSMPRADLAVMRLVLMHLPRPLDSLAACRAWIRPGGALLVAEGDDRAVSLEPEPAWLPELLDLMETVQVRRSGSRRRGLQVAGMLAEAGWSLLAQEQASFRLSELGDSFPAVFVPVARFYLEQAVQLGLSSADAAGALAGKLEAALGGALDEASVPVFYALASTD